MLRNFIKHTLNFLALAGVSPAVVVCYLESRISGGRSHRLFNAFGQFFALMPGLTGQCIRRAYYHGTLTRCDLDCLIGFGVLFSQPDAIVQSGVYIGPYALLGNVELGKGCLIGSRASILSSGPAHELDENGRWTAFDPSKVQMTRVGENTWVGEGAVIAANVGDTSMVSAGSVVGSPVPSGIMVAGNPARFVRRLVPEVGEPTTE